MANTIIIPTLFSKEVIRNRDLKNVFYKYTNSDYTGELKKAGNTVTVQTYQQSGGNLSLRGSSEDECQFGGYKLITWVI